MIGPILRPLHANQHAPRGTWNASDCSDALLQIASTVTELSRQLDRLWSLARPEVSAGIEANFEQAFGTIDAGLARTIEAFAITLQDQSDREAA